MEKLIERLVLQAKLGFGGFGFGGLDLDDINISNNNTNPLMRFFLLQNLFRRPVSRYYPAYRPIRRLNGIMYYRM